MAGFHEGERQVQAAAGVSALAARLEPMLEPAHLDGGARRFLAERELVVLTARDAAGTLWVSPLVGPPGLLEARGSALTIRAVPSPQDPLHDLPHPQPLGLLAIDLVARRRMRVNGTLDRVGHDLLVISVDEAYGNCPKFLHPHRLERLGASPTARSTGLDQASAALITSADTFFLGTTHPVRGNDASHRGGEPGFVRVQDGELWWPDFAGNNMFNSLGNLAVDDTAALLFLDWSTGTALQLSGAARLETPPVGSLGDEGGTGRWVRFTPSVVLSGT